MSTRSVIATVAATVGLAASVASGIDDLGPAAAFCAETGCATVRESAWARPLGVPMSLVGIGFFAVMLVLGFVERPRLRRMLAIAGGAWAVWLMVLQAFVIEAWCKLCLIADPAAIVLALAVLAGAPVIAMRWQRMAAIAAGGVMVLGGLALWTRTPVHAEPIAPAVARSSEGVTIIEMVDFECPYCREMQTRLDAAIAQTTVPVTIIRKMVPLRAHPGAMPAALAWCCADEQGKGDAMARALFEADVEELTTEGCERIAERVGCDLARYRDARPRAERRVAADVAEARELGVRGLPTLFIGDRHITGTSMSTSQLVVTIEQHAAGSRNMK